MTVDIAKIDAKKWKIFDPHKYIKKILIGEPWYNHVTANPIESVFDLEDDPDNRSQFVHFVTISEGEY